VFTTSAMMKLVPMVVSAGDIRRSGPSASPEPWVGETVVVVASDRTGQVLQCGEDLMVSLPAEEHPCTLCFNNVVFGACAMHPAVGCRCMNFYCGGCQGQLFDKMKKPRTGTHGAGVECPTCKKVADYVKPRMI
jgi:hypothetical protein